MPSEEPTAADRLWSRQVADHYKLHELESMCVWLAENISLNQQRLESQAARLSLVISLAMANMALLAATAEESAIVQTSFAAVVSVGAIWLAALGLRAEQVFDRDPTGTYESMWGPRAEGEVQVVLYRRRSVLFDQQRALIYRRAGSLKSSSWTLGAAAILAIFATLVSQF